MILAGPAGMAAGLAVGTGIGAVFGSMFDFTSAGVDISSSISFFVAGNVFGAMIFCKPNVIALAEAVPIAAFVTDPVLILSPSNENYCSFPYFQKDYVQSFPTCETYVFLHNSFPVGCFNTKKNIDK